MSDSAESDASPPPDPEGFCEDDIDKLLADAASLATDLSTELGEPDGEPGSPDPGQPASDVADSSDDLDAKLGELEGLLDEATEEVGSTAEVDDEPAQSPPAAAEVPDFMDEFTRPEEPADQDSTPDEGMVTSEGTAAGGESTSTEAPQPASDNAIPSFMDEFTHPEGESASDPVQPAPAPESAPPAGGGVKATSEKSGRVKTRPIGVVSNVAASAIDVTNEEIMAADAGQAADQQPAAEPSKGGGRLAELICRVRTRVAPLALLPCERGVRLLEMIDKPFARLGEIPRQILGWIAIATVGVSLILFVISLF